MRVLVCGSNYGANYLGALRYQGKHEIVGLLARGSARSHQVADAYGVPLLTSIDDVPDVDAACVAVGGAAGRDLSLALLARGVAVLREHPIGTETLDVLLEAAHQGRTTVHVNGHYSDFAPSSEFVAHARTLRSACAPLLIQVSSDAQFLWAILDVLASSMESSDYALESPVHRASPRDERLQVATCAGALGGVPLVLTYLANFGEEDDRSMGFFGDEISIDFLRGRLCMIGIDGMVLMHRNWWALHHDVPVRPELQRLCVGNRSAVEMVSSPPPQELDGLERRYVANARAVDRLLAEATDGTRPANQAPDYLRGLSKAWQHLTARRLTRFDATPLIVADGAPADAAAPGAE